MSAPMAPPAAAPAAADGQLVTFGIVPTGPETGYGYIKAAAGEPLEKNYTVDYVKVTQENAAEFAAK